jgi:hypothetical protein
MEQERLGVRTEQVRAGCALAACALRSTAYLVAALAALCLEGVLCYGADAAGIGLQTVRAGVLANRAAMGYVCVQAELTSENYTPDAELASLSLVAAQLGEGASLLSAIPPDFAGDVFRSTTMVRWSIRGPKRRLDVVTPRFDWETGATVLREETFLTDGQSGLLYLPGEGRVVAGRGPEQATVHYWEPSDFGLNCREVDIADILEAEDTAVVFRGTESLDGQECVKLNIVQDDTVTDSLWLDPAYGYLVRLGESYDRDGHVRMRCRMTEAAQSASGGWFPVGGSVEHFRGSDVAVSVTLVARRAYSALSVESAEWGPDGFFRLALPGSTRVENVEMKTSFTLAEATAEDMVGLEPLVVVLEAMTSGEPG